MDASFLLRPLRLGFLYSVQKEYSQPPSLASAYRSGSNLSPLAAAPAIFSISPERSFPPCFPAIPFLPFLRTSPSPFSSSSRWLFLACFSVSASPPPSLISYFIFFSHLLSLSFERSTLTTTASSPPNLALCPSTPVDIVSLSTPFQPPPTCCIHPLQHQYPSHCRKEERRTTKEGSWFVSVFVLLALLLDSSSSTPLAPSTPFSLASALDSSPFSASAVCLAWQLVQLLPP